MDNMQQFTSKFKKRLAMLNKQDVNNLFCTIASQLFIATKKRIFTDGILTDGSKLSYKGGDTLAGRSSFPNSKGWNEIAGSKEKRSKLKWVNVDGKSLFVVEGGYKKIKQASGRPNPFDFTGQLKKSYSYDCLDGEAILGFIDTSRLLPNGKPTSTKNAEIIEGLENEKGEIFALTEDEEKQVEVIAEQFIDELIDDL